MRSKELSQLLAISLESRFQAILDKAQLYKAKGFQEFLALLTEAERKSKVDECSSLSNNCNSILAQDGVFKKLSRVAKFSLFNDQRIHNCLSFKTSQN
jgi:N-glycosylase/DNA lyase